MVTVSKCVFTSCVDDPSLIRASLAGKLIYMGNLHTCGPNEVLVLSGGCCQSTKHVTGGWAWAWWYVTDVQRLNLEVITLNPECREVETAEGVPVSASAVAQVKVRVYQNGVCFLKASSGNYAN